MAAMVKGDGANAFVVVVDSRAVRSTTCSSWLAIIFAIMMGGELMCVPYLF